MNKKIYFLLAVALFALLCAACSGGGRDVSEETSAVTAETAVETVPITGKDGQTITDPGIFAWFKNGSELIHRDSFEVETKDSIAVSMAKNEMEGFQLILASAAGHTDVRCELGTLTDGKGHTLVGTVFVAFETYIKSAGKSLGQRGYLPTALMEQDDPYLCGKFDLVAGRSKTVYVLFRTGEDTVAGEYSGKISVTEGGSAVFEGDIRVTVWDIMYDEATRGIHMFGYGYSSRPGNLYCPTYDSYEKPASAPDMLERQDLIEIYCDFLVDYRITPYSLPLGGFGLQEEKAAKYLNDPRVSLTVLWGSQCGDLKGQYRIAEKNNWLDKIAFMEYDEPHEESHVDYIIGRIADSNRFFPTMKHFNALIKDLRKDGKNIIERLAPYTSIHCVKAHLFSGEIAESMLKLKEERGDTIMWYVCGDEPVSMIDGLPCIPGTEKRVLFWQQYLFDLDGFLMWQTCMWGNGDDIWEEGYGEKRIKPIGSGTGPTANGVFLYWHPVTQMPLSTLGLEAMRDGIEDYQLIMLADEYLGRDETMKYVNLITTGHSKFTRDSAYLLEVRNDLAKAVEAALKGLK